MAAITVHCTMCAQTAPAAAPDSAACSSCMEDWEAMYLESKARRDRARARPPLRYCVSCGDCLGVDMAADTKDPTRCFICAGAQRTRAFIRSLPLTVACDCGDPTCDVRWDIPTAVCGDCDERFPAEDGTHTDCSKRPPPPAATSVCTHCGDHYPSDSGGPHGTCGLDCYADSRPHWRREYD
jgi:hypothetical protein